MDISFKTQYLSGRRENIFYFLTYVAVFLLYFLPATLEGSFIGGEDSFGCMTLFKHRINCLVGLWTSPPGNVMYPTSGAGAYTEPFVGQTVLFSLFKLLQLSDQLAQYFFISVLLALNGFGFYIVGKEFTDKSFLAFLFGFIFASSGFMLAHFQNYNGVSYFFFCMSVYFAIRFHKTKSLHAIFGFYFSACILIYWSGYLFLALSILSLIGLIVYHKTLLQAFSSWHRILALLLCSIFLLPFTLHYLGSDNFTRGISPLAVEPEWFQYLSLNLDDLLAARHGNLLYSSYSNTVTGSLGNRFAHANIGISIYLLGILGLLNTNVNAKARLLIGIGIALFLLMSLGPTVSVGFTSFQSPLAALYCNDHVLKFVRMYFRFFGIVIALLLFSGLLYSIMVFKMHGWLKQACVITLSLFAIVENYAPYKSGTPYSSLLLKSEKTMEHLMSVPSGEVILHLPSSLPVVLSESKISDAGVHDHSREYRYMYWQNEHKRNIVNGISGGWPEERLLADRLIRSIDCEHSLDSLIDIFQISTILYHRDLKIYAKDTNYPALLLNSDRVEKVFDDSVVIAFRVIDFRL